MNGYLFVLRLPLTSILSRIDIINMNDIIVMVTPTFLQLEQLLATWTNGYKARVPVPLMLATYFM